MAIVNQARPSILSNVQLRRSAEKRSISLNLDIAERSGDLLRTLFRFGFAASQLGARHLSDWWFLAQSGWCEDGWMPR
jgi:hypothetical protein